MQFATVSDQAFRRYVVGDVVAILAFVVIGEIQHGHPVTHAAVTVLPFLAGWAIAAYALGVYGSDTVGSIRASLGRIAIGWAFADVLGQLIRVAAAGLGLLSGVDTAAGELFLFAVVTYCFGMLFLGVWRLVAWWVFSDQSAV